MSKPRIWLSRDDYDRCTPEDHARWEIGIDLTNDGRWRATLNFERDYIEEADAHGVTLKTLLQEKQ